jgi:L-alanine-DL-glutamate epimerase-like enolase superfamily enzyme
MLTWSLEPLRLELKYTWVISRNSSEYKPNFIVRVADNKGYSGIGEVAPNIRYGETPDIIEAFFKEFKTGVQGTYPTLSNFSRFLDSLPLPHALRFGIESAFVHYLCASQSKSIEILLGIIAPAEVKTCYSIPIMEPQQIEEFLLLNNLNRFPAIKIKVNKEFGEESLNVLKTKYEGSIYLDPNEAFDDADELLLFLEKIKQLNIAFIEQPMPSYCITDYLYAKSKSPFPFIADESVTDNSEMGEIAKQFHGVNMKLMKAGGYLKGIDILNKARKAGLKTMIGCMVESTLGIGSAMQLCHGVDFTDLDGFMIVKNEPFHYLSEQNGVLYLTKKFPI